MNSEKYQIRLRFPFLPVAKCGGKGMMLPLEVIKIAPRQRYQKKLGDQQLATLIRSTAKPADQRQREIEDWVREANINKDPVSSRTYPLGDEIGPRATNCRHIGTTVTYTIY